MGEAKVNETSVLVVVDVQNGFISDVSRPVIGVIGSLVARWQRNGGSTIFTRYINYPGSQFERLVKWTKLQKSPEIDLVAELIPYVESATAVIDKGIYSLFTDEGESIIVKNGWTDLYVCGIDTESCVLKTAVDAFERGLTPWVLADACASHSSVESHEAGLLVTRKFIGGSQIIKTADVPETVLPASA